MMKRISYILILFISLFIVSNVVKADSDDIVCPAKNDMQYNLVFSSIENGGMLKKVTTLKGDDITIYGRDRWRLNSKDDCPTSQNDFTVRKHESQDAYIVAPADSYIKRVNPDNSTEKGNTKTTDINGCSDIEDINTCNTNSKFSCVWVDKTTGNISNSQENGYCNVDTLQYVMCGREENAAFDIPTYLPRIISFVINFLKIVTPIILIFTSAISLLKAITASKEDEMEKAKKTLIRRIAIAALIFFTIAITQFVIEKVADDEEIGDFKDCLSCFVNNDCNASKYYKNNIDGEYKCFTVKTKTPIDNCH